MTRDGERLQEIRERAKAFDAPYSLPVVQMLAQDTLEVLERVGELERENERLREACHKLLNVHRMDKEGREDYVDAVLHMSGVMREIGAR